MLVFIFFLDVYGLYRLSYGLPNFVSFNINILIETFLLCIFFYRIFINPLVKKVLSIVLCFFVVFWLSQFLQNGLKEFLFSCANIENISILILALYYYYEQIIKANFLFFYIEKRFWIVSAYFVYVAGIFFLLIYLPTSTTNEEQLKFYVLNYVFVIIRTILLCIAMVIKNNNASMQSSHQHKAGFNT